MLDWQVVFLFDVRGQTAQCLLWLVLCAQSWVVELGHERVYATFCKQIGKDKSNVENSWGTADKMRFWLTEQLQESNSVELRRLFGLEMKLAEEYKLKGYRAETENPAALELLDVHKFEHLLVNFADVEWRFTQARSRNTRGVVAQNVRVQLDHLCFLSYPHTGSSY
jgi:hypothetical protein